jgi:plastocyanin
MRASPPIGEWHMHCHVLAHMMDGMMGSLLIVNGGESATFPLPSGQPCPTMPLNTGTPPPTGGTGPKTVNVNIVDFQYNPSPVNIKVGDTVHWIWQANQHSTTSDTAIWDSGVHNTGFTFDHTFNAAGNFPYHCSFHGPSMAGVVSVTT